MNIGGEISGHEISLGALVNPSDPEEAGADVILWMGSKKEPIYAHSIILKNASDFYKAAFSSRWNQGTFNVALEENAELDLPSDSVMNSRDPDTSSATSTASTACPSPTEASTAATRAHSTGMFEIHHSEYEKKHMLKVLHHIYRVPTTVETEDVIDVALLANHLLIRGLEEKCIQYVIESAKDVYKYAFRLYLLSSTVFIDHASNTKLMRLALEVIYQSFDACINAVPDVASLGQREVEALIVGLPLTAKQKWILLIIWAFAYTGMIDDSCSNPVEYVFEHDAWKEKLKDSSKRAVKDLLHLIPFEKLIGSDYIEYVSPFEDLGILNASLEDYLTWSFGTANKSLDGALQTKVELLEPTRRIFHMPSSFSTEWSRFIRKYVYDYVFLKRGKLLVALPEAGIGSDRVFKSGVDYRKKSPLKNSPHGSPICVHIFLTTKDSWAVVIVDAVRKTNNIVSQQKGDNMQIRNRNYISDRVNCLNYGNRNSCECRSCPTLVELKGTKGRVDYPRSLQNEQIRDYVIYYFD